MGVKVKVKWLWLWLLLRGSSSSREEEGVVVHGASREEEGVVVHGAERTCRERSSTSSVRSSRIGRQSCRDSAQASGPAGTSTREVSFVSLSGFLFVRVCVCEALSN